MPLLFTADAEQFATKYDNKRWSNEIMVCENAGLGIDIDTVFQHCSSEGYRQIHPSQRNAIVALCNTQNSCNISDPVTTTALTSSCMGEVQTIRILFDCISGK